MQLWIRNLSSYGGQIDDLFWLITALVGFWFVLAQVILFYFVFRYRRRPGRPALHVRGDKWGQLSWIIVPLILVVACDFWIDVATANVWENIKEHIPTADARIRVDAQQWAWTFTHPGPDGKLDTPDDIVTVDDLHIEVGKTYVYELRSKDVLHSFCIPVFRLKQDAIPGRSISGWFKATEAGKFDIQCTEICGIGHAFMPAHLTIESAEDHKKWMTPAAPVQQKQTFE